MPDNAAKIAKSPTTKTTGINRGEIQMMKSIMPVVNRRHMKLFDPLAFIDREIYKCGKD